MKKLIAALSVVLLAAAMFLQAAGPAATTPDVVVMDVADGLANGRPQVVWQAMPASYQADVSDLVYSFANTMDADIWNRSFGIMGKLAQVMVEKKDYIMDNPMFAQHAGQVQDVHKDWDQIAFVLSTLSQSDLGDIDRLRTTNPETFLAGTGSVLLDEIMAINAARGTDSPWDKDFRTTMHSIQASLVSLHGGTAVVNISGPDGTSKNVTFVLVEDKWVPEEMAQDWSRMIAQARSSLESIQPEQLTDNKNLVLAALTTVDSSLDQMLAAESYTDFNNALQGLVGAGMMHMMTLQQQLQAQEEAAPQDKQEN